MEKSRLNKLPSNFRLASFRFVLSSENITFTPYSGSILRGGFGYVFKKITCISREKLCKDCILKEKCVYSYIFESPAPGEKRYPYVPHPFIIEPSTDKEDSFDLVLVGKAIDYLPYFIYTFEELGKKGLGRERRKFNLELVEDSDGNVVYEGKEKILHKGYKKIYPEDILKDDENNYSICLEFLTPTRIKYQGKLIKDITFEIVIRNLLRRISLLSLYHCDEKWDVDFRGIIERAKRIEVLNSRLRWQDWERYSTRQKTRMQLGGFIDKVEFKGNLSPFMSYLRLGEYIHIGKATAFGLGKYKIKKVDR